MRHEYPRVAWDQDFTVLNTVQGFCLWYRKGATAHTIRFQGTKGVKRVRCCVRIRNNRRSFLSSLVVVALFALCVILGGLQFRWIAEVSIADRERLRRSLDASLRRVSQDFNAEIAAAVRGLLPSNPQPNADATEAALAERYEEWSKVDEHKRLFESRRCCCGAQRQNTLPKPESANGRLRKRHMACSVADD